MRGIQVNGLLIRQLRSQAGLTQEEAAERARLSVRLIRKAERGERLDAYSVRRLAEMFQRLGRPMQPRDLRLAAELGPGQLTGDCHEADGEALAGRGVDPETGAWELLRQYLTGIWGRNWREAIERLVDPQVVLRCEQGALMGRDALLGRVEHLHQTFRPVRFSIEQQRDSGSQAAARWQLHGRPRQTAPAMADVRHGMTTIATRRQRIVQVWDFWSPGLPLPTAAGFFPPDCSPEDTERRPSRGDRTCA